MSVSLYHEATRPVPLTPEERTRVEALAEQCTASFRDDEEGLTFYDEDPDDPEPDQPQTSVILAGSTKPPLDPDRYLRNLWQLFKALTAIRRAVPGAEWDVRLDDTEVNWDDEAGYSLPGIERSWWQRLQLRLALRWTER